MSHHYVHYVIVSTLLFILLWFPFTRIINTNINTNTNIEVYLSSIIITIAINSKRYFNRKQSYKICDAFKHVFNIVKIINLKQILIIMFVIPKTIITL